MSKGAFISIAAIAALSCHAPDARAESGDAFAILVKAAAQATEPPRPADHRLDAARGAGSSHRVTLDWGSGGLALRGDRSRANGKPERLQTGGHEWHSTLAAGLSGWAAVSPSLALVAGVRLVRTKSTTSLAPSWRSSAMAKEFSIALQDTSRAGLRLSLFDKGGWSSGDLGVTALRMMNGEQRARKGAAAEFGLLEGLREVPGGDRSTLVLRLERATSPSLAAETAARLTWKLKF